MSMTRVAATVHKWLALAALIPILFWFSSGLFFAISPIERVRSEHRIAHRPSRPVTLADAAAGLKLLASHGAADAAKIEIRSLLGRPVALVTRDRGRPVLFDLRSAKPLSPIPAATARAIAANDYDGPGKVTDIVAVTRNSPEYRGALPAWEVRLASDDRLSIYVAADTGQVTARRSSLWRTYDWLWGLHILDLKDHENFNSALLIAAVTSALLLLASGIVLIPARFGWIR